MIGLPGCWPAEPSTPSSCGKPQIPWSKNWLIRASGGICIDDTIQSKPYSRENELICWHYDLIGIYQRRWKTEEYHKSIKHCSKLGESPAHTPTTQHSHCMAVLISYVKLENLKLKNRLNHLALKRQIWVEATRHALQSMSKLSTNPDKYAYLTV